MENIFKIAKYVRVNDTFVNNGYDEYHVTYLKSNKAHELRIVVNGFLTKQRINIVNHNSGYKNNILLAIKEYIVDGDKSINRVTKRVKMSYIESFYAKNIVNNIKKYLLPINKEDSRDKLSELGFIFN